MPYFCAGFNKTYYPLKTSISTAYPSHSSKIFKKMDNSKKIQFGLLGLVAVLGIAYLASGKFKSEGDTIRGNAVSASNGVRPVESSASGNIPGTNVTAAAAPSGPATTIKYDEDSFDFGVTDEGEVVKHEFKFKNSGNEPLLISNCKGSCGCTVPTWPKEPIPPGGTAAIHVEFNSKGKPGNQSKRITVTANTVPTETFLEIKGTVKGKEQPAVRDASGATRPQPADNGQIQQKPRQ